MMDTHWQRKMKQVEKLLGTQVKEVHVDMGYRGHDYKGKTTIHVDKRQRGRTPQSYGEG